MSDVKVPEKVRAWYGLSGEILVENELWHLVRIGPLSLPHPPLINLFLRAGLPREKRLRLSFEHEYGHLQALPLALLHLALLRRRRASMGSWLAALIAHQAVWELAAEGWVVAKLGREYRETYHGRGGRPAIFWLAVLGLASLGTLRALRG